MRPFRIELKFLVHYRVRELLLERWERYLARAPFTNRDGVSPVLSQYYDSPDLDFYHEKLAGVAVRTKVRLRTYGLAFAPGATTFLEIKQRRNDRIRKLRYAFPDFDSSQLEPRHWRIDDPRVAGWFLFLRERRRLRPSARVFYQREAYQGSVNDDLRITFDTCLTALHAGEPLRPGLLADSSRALMSDTLAILEVKATRGIPAWVHEGIVAGELEQRTFSKYVAAVEKLGLVDRGGSGVWA